MNENIKEWSVGDFHVDEWDQDAITEMELRADDAKNIAHKTNKEKCKNILELIRKSSNEGKYSVEIDRKLYNFDTHKNDYFVSLGYKITWVTKSDGKDNAVLHWSW
jgi:hypothetical protein